MTAEEWLREHSNEAERPAPPGGVAKHSTDALPEDGAPVADEHATRGVPSVVRLDIHIGGDMAEWPTMALPDVHILAHGIANGDDQPDPTATTDTMDDTVEVTTEPLPIVPPVEDVSRLPTRRLRPTNS